MNIIRSPSKVVQLRTRLPTLLQLPLEPTMNMIKRQPTLPRRSHAPTAHTSHTAYLHLRAPRNIVTPLRECERSAAVRLGGTARGTE
jgi:hypothetical protein